MKINKNKRDLEADSRATIDGTISIFGEEGEQILGANKIKALYMENADVNENSGTKISFIDAIQAIYDRNNDRIKAFNRRGVERFKSAHIERSGNIALPYEYRTITSLSDGLDTMQLAAGLRNASVLGNTARWFFNLSANLNVPVYSGSKIFWETETGTAPFGDGFFSREILKPKRLCCVLDISEQFLIQSPESESIFLEDLKNAIMEKIEQCLLGDGTGSLAEPQGIFDIIPPLTITPTYTQLLNIEETLEKNKIHKNLTYLVSPSMRTKLASTEVASGTGKFILENNRINGIPVLSSGNVLDDGLVLGAFSDYIIAFFGGIDILVDPYSQVTKGIVRYTVNTFVDAFPRRKESFITAKL